MDHETMEELLADAGALLLEPRSVFDAALVGIAERAGGLLAAAYDSALVVQALMAAHGWDEDEAHEYFAFNTRGAWAGPGTPVFLDLLRRDG